MKKSVICVLMVGVGLLTAFIFQRPTAEMPAIAAAMGADCGVYAGEKAGGKGAAGAEEMDGAAELPADRETDTASGKAPVALSQSGSALKEGTVLAPGDEVAAAESAGMSSGAGEALPAPGPEPAADRDSGPVNEPAADRDSGPVNEPAADRDLGPVNEPAEDMESAADIKSATDMGEAPETGESRTAPAFTEDAPEEESSPEEVSGEEESEYANLAIAQVDHYVNVRQQPGTDSEILGKIYNGAVAQILDVAGDEQDWFHVVSGSVEGYIKAEYFLYGDAAVEAVDDYVTRYATVIADRLNVRQEPGIESGRIGYISHGEKVKILEPQEDWLLVQYTEGQTGYVAAEYVTVSEEFIYAKSLEEERAEQAAQRELEERMAAREQAAPENTVVTPLTPPAALYTSNEELRRSIVDYAMLYLGYPYVHGGRSLAGGTDCSGFTCYIYADFGYSISRTPSGQYSSDGRSIDYSEIQPGDIICYGKSKCTHVGMYIGDGQIIHAANSRKGVVIYDAGYDNILGVKNIID